MVRISSRKQLGGSGVMSTSGVLVPTTAAGTSLGGGTVSAGNTATANNVSTLPSINIPINNYGPSIKQIGGTAVANSSGIHTVGPAGTVSESSSSTNYKLSIASMLLAMKNQALGSLSLGGSKAGGSITENYSGINLG